MAEVKFDIADAAKFARDHYLSVRVGEMQKLAKITTTRSYKFPASAVGSRKYGKVELFKRVGASTFCLDPELAATSAHEVCMVLEDASTICLNAIVGGASVQKRVEGEAALKQEVASPMATKLANHQSVSDYLNEHHLEVRLSDAMQTILRERPKDPVARLAEIITQNAETIAGLPVPAKASFAEASRADSITGSRSGPAADAKSGDRIKASCSASQQELSGLHRMCPSSGCSTALGPQETVPFGTYYANSFRSLPSSFMEALHSAFSVAPRLPEVSAADEGGAPSAVQPTKFSIAPFAAFQCEDSVVMKSARSEFEEVYPNRLIPPITESREIDGLRAKAKQLLIQKYDPDEAPLSASSSADAAAAILNYGEIGSVAGLFKKEYYPTHALSPADIVNVLGEFMH